MYVPGFTATAVPADISLQEKSGVVLISLLPRFLSPSRLH